MNINLDAPIWGISHLAAALGLSIDTARDKTYSPTFPAAKAGFSSNLWLREEVLVWFASLPAADRSHPSTRRTTAARTAPTASIPAVDPAVTVKPYKPRAKKAVA